MKKKILIAFLALGCISFSASAQVSFGISIGSQPAWGPTGYETARYYYIPDIDAYYDLSRRVYIYRNGSNWRRYSRLPARYRNIDLYRVHKVVINDDRPWLHHDKYYREYSHYKGRYDQEAIRDSRDKRYYQNPHNKHYKEWRQNRHHNDNDHHRRDQGRNNRKH